MINQIGRYILSLVFIMLIQIMILNNLNIGSYINPFLYVLFIIILPVETPNWLLLIIGFFIGLIMDTFLNTPGMHASAMLFMSFIRPHYLQLVSPREGYEPGSEPTASSFGVGWFMKYSLLLVLSHHIFLFFVEAFTFTTFFSTLLKAILSSFSTLFVILIASMFGKQSKKRF